MHVLAPLEDLLAVVVPLTMGTVASSSGDIDDLRRCELIVVQSHAVSDRNVDSIPSHGRYGSDRGAICITARMAECKSS